MKASRIQDAVPSRRGILAGLVLAIACVPVLAACATTFGSPLRHTVANLQATSVDVGTDLRIDGLIVALPNGTSADTGDVAYIEFNVANTASQPDELVAASAKATGPAVPGTSNGGTASPNAATSGSAASGAPGPSGSPGASTDLSKSTLPVGSTTIPAATAQSPGTARLTVALMSLTQPLSQGDSVLVSLQFANGGAIDNVLVPVQGSDAVSSSFLPSAPPSIPSSPASSSLESPLASGSAPASAPPSSPASSS